MTVEQIMNLNAGGLGESSRRNALRVLYEMEQDGLIKSWRMGVKLFSLPDRNFGNFEHTLLRNDFLIHKGWFDKCRMEVPIKRNGVVQIVADAGVWENERWTFIEIDRRQKRHINLEKVKKYKELGQHVIAVCYRARANHFPGIEKHFIEDWMT